MALDRCDIEATWTLALSDAPDAVCSPCWIGWQCESAREVPKALAWLPGRLPDLARCDYLTGVDPVFAGLHNFESTHDGRSFSVTAHVAMGSVHASDRRTTVVLPRAVDSWVLVHELGHVIHEAAGFPAVTGPPVSAYAATTPWEAFAEAMCAWLWPAGYPRRISPEDAALMSRLAWG